MEKILQTRIRKATVLASTKTITKHGKGKQLATKTTRTNWWNEQMTSNDRRWCHASHVITLTSVNRLQNTELQFSVRAQRVGIKTKANSKAKEEKSFQEAGKQK